MLTVYLHSTKWSGNLATEIQLITNQLISVTCLSMLLVSNHSQVSTELCHVTITVLRITANIIECARHDSLVSSILTSLYSKWLLSVWLWTSFLVHSRWWVTKSRLRHDLSASKAWVWDQGAVLSPVNPDWETPPSPTHPCTASPDRWPLWRWLIGRLHCFPGNLWGPLQTY